MKPLDDAMVNILTELIEKYQVYKSGDLNSHRMRDAWKEVSFSSSYSCMLNLQHSFLNKPFRYMLNM